MKNVGADAQGGEDEQERQPAAAPVGDRPEDRRDDGVEADADDDRDRQQHVPVALAELAGR